MKVLVTGGAGYIGSVTSELLLNEGHEAVIFDNLEKGHRRAIDERARFHHGDLRDPQRISEVVKAEMPDAVMHFAAYIEVGQSMADPLAFFENNTQGGFNLARAAADCGIPKFIFSSTCATYGQPERIPIDEREKQHPESPYGESKLQLERILHWIHQIHGTQTVYLRYFNASGATEKFGEDHNPETHLIPLVLQVALGQREQISIFGVDYDTPDGTCIRDYIHIVDLAQAHILALESDQSGPFNLGNGNGYSVRQLIEVAREVTGHPIPAVVAPRRDGDPPRLVANADKARSVLGWNPRHAELKTIIQHAWNWHRAHPDGYES